VKEADEPEEPKDAKPKWQKPWEKDTKEEVTEDDDQQDLIQNGTMFPVQTGAMPAPNPQISNPGPSATSTPAVGGQNNNPSTRPAMTPADMRARQQNQTANNQAPVATAPPTNGQPMTPPNEQGAPVPASAQRKMAPTNNVNNPKKFQFQRQQ
jgi:hypothetical protein